MTPPRANAEGHRWEFKARFRRHAFGWRSQPAIQRIKQAVGEIKRVARRDPVLAANGAVTLLERLSPALEHVDGSSGAIGTAVNRAMAELVPIIGGAPADAQQRTVWLERLWAAHEADQIPYIEQLGEFWGELCASKEVASVWADRLFEVTRLALSPDRGVGGFPLCRGPWTNDADVDAIGEEILLSSVWSKRRTAATAYGPTAGAPTSPPSERWPTGIRTRIPGIRTRIRVRSSPTS